MSKQPAHNTTVDEIRLVAKAELDQCDEINFDGEQMHSVPNQNFLEKWTVLVCNSKRGIKNLK